MTFPLATAHAVGEVGHLVEHGVNFGHNVLAVDHDGSVSGRAQSRVQYRAFFRDVDLLAAEHRIDALAQAGFFGKLKQELQGFVGDAVLGIVEKHADGFGSHALTALRIVGE